MKHFLSFLVATLTAVAVVVPTVSASEQDNQVYRDTKYQPISPIRQILTNVVDELIGEAVPFSDVISPYLAVDPNFLRDNTPDNVQTEVDNLSSDKFYSRINSYRLLGLTAYANSSTTPSNLKDFGFIAKRRIVYPDESWELDTMFYWYSNFTDLYNPDFQGVQIGNFYLQPNTCFVSRIFSDGTTKSFYLNAQDFRVINYGSRAFYVDLTTGSTVTCYNDDGTIDSLVVPPNYTMTDVYFFDNPTNDNNQPISNISSKYLLKASEATQKYSSAFSGGWLNSAECLIGNTIFNDNGNNKPFFGTVWGSSTYDLKAPSLNLWYISSGGYVGGQTSATTNFYNTNSNNIDPSRPPAIINTNTIYNTPITNNNISNYADYGITYNSDTNKFDVDLAALGAAVGAEIAPQFDALLDGTFSLQPDIGATFDSANLINNYTDDFEQLVVDVQNQIDNLRPSPPWVAPTFPAVSTNPLIDYTFPVLPTETVPQNVIDDVGTVVNIGFDALDTLDITAIFIALAVLGAVAWYIWG